MVPTSGQGWKHTRSASSPTSQHNQILRLETLPYPWLCERRRRAGILTSRRPSHSATGEELSRVVDQARNGKVRRLEAWSHGQTLEIARVDGLGNRGKLEVPKRDVPGDVADWSARGVLVPVH